MTVMQLRPSEGVNLHGQDTGRDHLSQSTLSLFLACRRKYQLSKLERLELISRPRPLDMGKAYQKAIELQDPSVGPRVLRGRVPCETCKGHGTCSVEEGARSQTGGESATAPLGLLSELDTPCSACKGSGGKQGPEPFIASQDDENRLRVEEVTVECAAALYLKRWPATQQEQREVPYLVRLRNPATGRYSNTFDLLGYADGVIDCGGWLELIENKLVGQVTELSVKRLPLDRQLALERYALWRATGKEVRRVRYRWVRKPSIRPRGGRKQDKSDAESIDAFLDRLRLDYEARAEDFYSHEEQFFCDPADMLRVEAELWEWADQLRRQRRQGFFDRNTSHCTDFGGCAFIPICTGDPDAAHLYRVRAQHNEPEEAAAA